MKTFNSHAATIKNLQYFPRFPRSPKVVLMGSPNVGTSTFAHRLAIDLGVPAVSMKDIYRSILTFEETYKQETFYRNVIDLLKSAGDTNINKELEDNLIPEKLLTLTKYTELGFVLYDYPNSIRQAENLESLDGGVSLFVNLLLNKELAGKREAGNCSCEGCGRNYNSKGLAYKDENINWPASYPKSGICDDVINFIIFI